MNQLKKHIFEKILSGSFHGAILHQKNDNSSSTIIALAPAGIFSRGIEVKKGELVRRVATWGLGGRSPRRPEKISIYFEKSMKNLKFW